MSSFKVYTKKLKKLSQGNVLFLLLSEKQSKIFFFFSKNHHLVITYEKNMLRLNFIDLFFFLILQSINIIPISIKI